jgi:SulP family sulfate permease
MPDQNSILLTAALAVLAGLISILTGLSKMGRMVQFLSESVMVGFIAGLARPQWPAVGVLP